VDVIEKDNQRLRIEMEKIKSQRLINTNINTNPNTNIDKRFQIKSGFNRLNDTGKSKNSYDLLMSRTKDNIRVDKSRSRDNIRVNKTRSRDNIIKIDKSRSKDNIIKIDRMNTIYGHNKR